MEEWNDFEQEELLKNLKDAENLAICLREKAVRNVIPEEKIRASTLDSSRSDIYVMMESVGDHGVVMTLPAMLPRRVNGDKARFLVRPMTDACQRYQEEYMKDHEGRQLKFSTCVLVYEHIYGTSRYRRFIDHDNLELKHCQDVLEEYFLTNDTSAFCSAFQCSHREGRTDATRIWILQPKAFPRWLKEHRMYWEITDPLSLNVKPLPEKQGKPVEEP